MVLVEEHSRESFVCNCAGCRGDEARGAKASMSRTPRSDIQCKWRHQHAKVMRELNLDPAKVDGYSRRQLKRSPGSVSSPRYRHVLDVADVLDKFCSGLLRDI